MFNRSKEKPIRIADVYPDRQSDDQAEIEYNLRRYILLVWRIYERTKRQNPKLLTKLLKRGRV